MSGASDFEELKKDVRKVAPWAAGSFAAPAVAVIQDFGAPWPSRLSVAFITAAAQTIALLYAFHFWSRPKGSRRLDRRAVVALALLVVSFAAYAYLLDAYTFVHPKTAKRQAAGFVLRPEIRSLIPEHIESAEKALRGSEYVAEKVWSPGSVTAVRLTLLAVWLVMTTSLTVFVVTLMIAQRRKQKTGAGAERRGESKPTRAGPGKKGAARKLLLGFVPAATLIALTLQASSGQPGQAAGRQAATPRPAQARLYEGLHALVIGMRRYESPAWKELTGAEEDVSKVKAALEKLGFAVEDEMDLTGRALAERIEKFIREHGRRKENGLLIYYTGHGYSMKPSAGGPEVGFIVPSDAPGPRRDEKGFLRTAISMDRMREYARKIEAKHALFVLDSCFSGSLVDAAGQDSSSAHAPRRQADGHYVEEMARLPVRHFITSGTNKQEVPASGLFREKFINALDAESNNNADALPADNYVTGLELGEYLKSEIIGASARSQRPVSHKEEGQGEFLFRLARVRPLPLNLDAAMWDLPGGWAFGPDALAARGRGLALPKNSGRFSYRNFEVNSLVEVGGDSGAGLVLRARDEQNYYLLQLTGGNWPDRARRYKLEAFVVKGGLRVTPPLFSIPVDGEDMKGEMRRGKDLRVRVRLTGTQFTVRVSSGDRDEPLAGPYNFTDYEGTFKSGRVGFLIEDKERFKVYSFAVKKLESAG